MMEDSLGEEKKTDMAEWKPQNIAAPIIRYIQFTPRHHMLKNIT